MTRIAAGSVHSCAATSDGRAYCWGNNSFGQLGDNTTTQRSVPIAVNASGALAGKTVAGIDAGDTHTCALTTDGGAYCWGNNDPGQLGDNTLIQRNAPVAVDASGVLAGRFLWQIEAGLAHTVAAGPACGPGIDLTSGPKALWHAFSLPDLAGIGAVRAHLGTGSDSNLDSSQYGVANPAGGTGWVVYRRDDATKTNVKVALDELLRPGVGYLIKSFQKTRTGKLFIRCPNAIPVTNVTQAQGCSSANGCLKITLSTTQGANKNLVGNPFPWKIDWSKVRVRVNSSPATYTPSQAAGLAPSGNASPPVLGNTFWVWDGTSYDSFSDTAPTQGSLPYEKSFWVDLLAGAQGKTVELLIPKDPTTLAQ